MCRRLLFTLVFCLFFATILSLRCYTGTDRQCIPSPDMEDCGSGDKCQCSKYYFQCTDGDQACNEEEQANGVKKWAYTILPASVCQLLKEPASGYEKVTCCSTDKCNRPSSGKCSWAQARRRDLRKLADLLDF